MNTTAIKKCRCKSAFQDEEYGQGHRVHNSMMKDKKLRGYRCTVCKHEIEVNTK